MGGVRGVVCPPQVNGIKPQQLDKHLRDKHSKLSILQQRGVELSSLRSDASAVLPHDFIATVWPKRSLQDVQ